MEIIKIVIVKIVCLNCCLRSPWAFIPDYSHWPSCICVWHRARLAGLTAVACLTFPEATRWFIEVLQKFMGLGRSMDFFDWLADVAGAVCAMAVMQLFMLRKMRKAIGGKSRV